MSVRAKRSLALGPARLVGATYADVILADGPAAYWRMNDGTSPLADSSLTGINLPVSGTVTYHSAGLISDGSDAILFGGGHATTSSGVSALDTSTALTVEAWIKTSLTSRYQGIVDRDYSTSASVRAFQFRLETGTGKLQMIVTGSGPVTCTGSANLADGNPHHVVGTYDGSTIRLYVDGVASTTASRSGTMPSGSPIVVGNLYAGATSIGAFSFSGTIDEVAYYKSVLSPTQIAAHYAAGI